MYLVAWQPMEIQGCHDHELRGCYTPVHEELSWSYSILGPARVKPKKLATKSSKKPCAFDTVPETSVSFTTQLRQLKERSGGLYVGADKVKLEKFYKRAAYGVSTRTRHGHVETWSLLELGMHWVETHNPFLIPLTKRKN